MSFTKSRLALTRPDRLPSPGDILLFTHAEGITRVIPWYTGSRYYHCGLYEGGGNVLEARPHGVLRRNIANEPGNVFRIIPMDQTRGPQALEYCRNCLGKRYDILDVVFIMMRQSFPNVRINYSNHDSLVCSELVVLAWRHAGLDLFPGQAAAAIIPGDFQRFLPVDSHDMTLSPDFLQSNCTLGPDASK